MPNDTPRPRPVFNTKKNQGNYIVLSGLNEKLTIDHLFKETSTREKNAKAWFQQMGFEGLKTAFSQLECKDDKETAARNLLIQDLNSIKECYDQLQVDENEFGDFDQETQKTQWNALMEKIDSLNDFKKHLNAFNELTSYQYMTTDFMNVSYGVMRGVDALTAKAQCVGYTDYAKLFNQSVSYLLDNRDNVEEDFQSYLTERKNNDDHIVAYLEVEKKLNTLEDSFLLVKNQLSAKKPSTENTNNTILTGLSNLQNKTLEELEDGLGTIKTTRNRYTTILDVYRAKKNAYDEIYEMDKGAREKVDVLQNQSMGTRITEDLDDFEKRLGENKRFFHINSSEYRALKNAVKDYKEHRDYIHLTSIWTAANAYLAAKLKGRENDSSSTSMRDYRLNLARELRDYAQEKLALLEDERTAKQNMNDNIWNLEQGRLHIPLTANGDQITQNRYQNENKPDLSYSYFSEQLKKITTNYQKGIEELQKQGIPVEKSAELPQLQQETGKIDQIDTSMLESNQ